MGFYGNITNTAKTQFQFDRIYPNRYEVEQNKSQDGIYQGRYVLIEYDSDLNLDDFKRVWIDSNGYGYTSPNMELTSRINVGGSIEKGTIVRTQTVDLTPENGLQAKDCVFYKCIVADIGAPAIFEYAVDSDSNYVLNFNIDTAKYGAGRGYDSTVWQKVFDNGQDKYVMIAELNTVVPTFDVVADAPTVEPITPHFDIDSTDVYYKLHMQPQWGFKIKAQEDEVKSDEVVNYNWTEYNPATNENIPRSLSYDGDIYYNKKGFEEFTPKTQDDVTVNEISILPTGKSGKEYSTHIGAGTSQQIDTQEVTIHLPAIGNVVADAWDIIHGENRDDNTSNSLQGRLNFFNKLGENEIPVQAQGGYLVGSMINGNTNRVVEDWEILNEKLSESFDSDDAWIKTAIRTSSIAEGEESDPEDGSYHQKAISIHHTWHQGSDTSFTSNVNGKGDTINLITPIKDATGHIVAHNTETVILPYGFKSISTNGRVKLTEKEGVYATEEPKIDKVWAKSTQHNLQINGGNKWIKIDTENESDKESITISHDILETSFTESDANLTDEDKATTFEVTTYDFDEAGHYSSKDIKTITVPYGYGKVVGDNGNTAATATFDTLTFSSDDWLTATIKKDEVIYSHDYPKKINDITTLYSNKNIFEDSEEYKNQTGANKNILSDEKTKNELKLQTVNIDDTGHVISRDIETVTLPFGFKTVQSLSKSSLTSDPASNTASTSANSTQDILKIGPSNKWICTAIEMNEEKHNIRIGHLLTEANSDGNPSIVGENKTPAFGDTFTIPELKWDEAGHISEVSAHTVQIPKGSLETINKTEESNVLTGISFDPGSGKITVDKTVGGAIVLSNYGDKKGAYVSKKDTITGAIKNLDSGLKEEVDQRKKAIEDTNSRIDALIGEDENGNPVDLKDAFDTLIEMSNWLDENDNNVADLISSVNTLTGSAEDVGSVKNQITKAITSLDTEIVTNKDNQFITSITQTDGIISEVSTKGMTWTDTNNDGEYVSSITCDNGAISISHRALPSYTLSSGNSNGTIRLNNGSDVAVQGLKDAAYKSVSEIFNTSFSYGEEFKTISELFTIVAEQAKIIEDLKAKLNQYHSETYPEEDLTT